MTEEQLNQLTDEAAACFNPFGYMDLKAAVRTANEVGERPSWVAELVEEKAEEWGMSVSKVDPVDIVYDSILQHARNEIEQLTGYDLSNDCASGEIYVAGNFCCTSYDYTEAAKEELKSKLKKAKVSVDDFDLKTQWFLSELEIDLSKKIKKKVS